MSDMRMGDKIPTPSGYVVPWAVNGTAGVTEGDGRHDRSDPAGVARARGEALIAAAEAAERMVGEGGTQ